MAFEHFISMESEHIAVIIRQEKGKSAIEVIANKMISESKSELAAYENSKFDHKSNTLIMDLDFRRGMVQYHKKGLGGLVLGISLLGIHNALTDGKMSNVVYSNLWNSKVSGVISMIVEIPKEEKIQEFSLEQMREMRALAVLSPNLVGFFTPESKHLLPQAVVSLIKQKGLKQPVGDVLAEYDTVSQDHLAQNYLSDSTISERVRTLDAFDSLILNASCASDTKKATILESAIRSQQEEIENAIQLSHGIPIFPISNWIYRDVQDRIL